MARSSAPTAVLLVHARKVDQSPAEFEASTDPFIQLAVAMYPGDIAREAEAKARSGAIQAARSAYMRGMLAYAESQGRTLYPDANGSLRFTYGKVTGKSVDGETWHPFTTAEGLVAKHTGDTRSGAINAVTPHPFDANIMFIASVNGGRAFNRTSSVGGTCSAPRWSRQSVKPPVEAPASRAVRPATSIPNASRAASSLSPPRLTKRGPGPRRATGSSASTMRAALVAGTPRTITRPAVISATSLSCAPTSATR